MTLKITQDELLLEAIRLVTGWQTITKVTPLNNGCYAVGTIGKGKIVSGSKVRYFLADAQTWQRAKIRKLVQNSRSVNLELIDGLYVSDTGHVTDGRQCSCQYQQYQNDFDFNICKHAIKASKLMGIQNFSQWMTA